MLSVNPRAFDNEPNDTLPLEAPERLVERYLELARTRREVDDQLAFIRGELELIAAAALNDAAPRGRFVGPSGFVSARLRPTCTFDRQAVGTALQRAGRLHEVAILQGPTLARYLSREPVVAARLGNLVRYRHSILLAAGGNT